MDQPKIVFTDGASTVKWNDGLRYGGAGVYFGLNDINNISKSYIGRDVTNQRMELMAAILGIQKCMEIGCAQGMIIYTDSLYVINTITQWYGKWSKPACNLDLINMLYKLSQENDVRYFHVRSHQKEPNKDTLEWSIWFGNKQADLLATKAKAFRFEKS